MTHLEARKWIFALANRLGDKAEELFDEARDRERTAANLSVLCITLGNEAVVKLQEELKDVKEDDVSTTFEDPDDDDDLDVSWNPTSQGGVS